MSEFNYDCMRFKYGSKIKLCYMDTDSFVYEIETEDFCRDMLKMWRKSLIRVDIERMIASKSLPIGKNKKVIGLMKDELGGKIMTAFVALRAKMYAYRRIERLAAQHEHFVACDKKCCKGTTKCVVSEGLTFDDYKTCLFDGETIYMEQMLFENKKHEVYTVNNKIALNRDKVRRIVQADGITTALSA